MIYVVCTLLSAFFAAFSTRVSNGGLGQLEASRQKAVGIAAVVLSFLPLYLLCALRKDVGTDYQSYIVCYEHPEWVNNHAPLFDGMLAVLRLLGGPQLFFVVSSAWICCGYFYAIYRYSWMPVYSLLLFVVTEDYFVSMNVVRQYMAIAVLIVFLPAFRKLDIKKLILAFAIAMMLHLSAGVVLLLVLLLRFVDPNPKFAFGVGIVVGILGLIGLPLLRPLLALTPFGTYFSNGYSTSWWGPTIPQLAIYVCILAVLSFCCDLKRAWRDPDFRILYHAETCCFWVMVVSLYMPSNFYRLTYFFNAFFVICFPKCLKYMKKPWMKWVIGVGCLCGYALWTFLLLHVGNQDVLPYQTVFQ